MGVYGATVATLEQYSRIFEESAAISVLFIEL
jgi:hypothetical protein